MNIAEGLSRELERVVIIREGFRRSAALDVIEGLTTSPVVAALDLAIEAAHQAAGSGDALDVMRAHAILQRVPNV